MKDTSASTDHRFLAFIIADEHYALPLLSVREVIAVPTISRMPNTPTYVLGVANLRGQIISVLDLRLKLGARAERSPENVIIICDIGDLTLGVLVDAVTSVVSIEKSQIQPRPELDKKSSHTYITGVAQIDQRLIIILSIADALHLTHETATNNNAKLRSA